MYVCATALQVDMQAGTAGQPIVAMPGNQLCPAIPLTFYHVSVTCSIKTYMEFDFLTLSAGQPTVKKAGLRPRARPVIMGFFDSACDTKGRCSAACHTSSPWHDKLTTMLVTCCAEAAVSHSKHCAGRWASR